MPSRPTAIDLLRDPLADPPRDRVRLRLAAMMVAMGILHLVVPRPFVAIVPRWFPRPRGAALWSGIAEVASGTLLAVPRTRRAGAALTTATLLAVYPANVQMALDASAGRSAVAVPAWVAWLRLPLQVPMVRAAWSFVR